MLECRVLWGANRLLAAQVCLGASSSSFTHTPPLPGCRRRRRLWRMCWAWRCSGRASRATCWWGRTASSPTRGAWWRRRWAHGWGRHCCVPWGLGACVGGASCQSAPMPALPASRLGAAYAQDKACRLVHARTHFPPLHPQPWPQLTRPPTHPPRRRRWRTWMSCPACCRCRWWRGQSTAAATSSAQVGGGPAPSWRGAAH